MKPQTVLFPIETIPVPEPPPLNAWIVASWWQGGWWKMEICDTEEDTKLYLNGLASKQGHGKKLVFKVTSDETKD